MKRSDSVRKSAFALVITLVMLALAAVVVVGLLASTSLDRVTARSYDDRYQAELAVQNGLEAAKQALVSSPAAASGKLPVTADDAFLVTRVDGAPDPTGKAPAYYYLAKPQAKGNGGIDYYPLFAGGTAQSLSSGIDKTSYDVTPPTPPAAAFATDPAQEKFGTNTRYYPQVLPSQASVFTQWIEVANPNDPAVAPAHNLPYQRFTYWIEDLSGYVDAEVAGNVTGSGGSHSRPLDQSTSSKRYQTTPAELAMFTVFDSAAEKDPANTAAKTLIDNRPLLYTVPTLRQLAPGPGATDITTAVFATALRPDSELPLVPFGFGYKDEGDPGFTRLQINDQVKSGGDAAVKAIAQKINVNLPDFGAKRKGGLDGQDYVNTIASSIIDYADADSDATVGSDYRGYDSYPLLNELYTMKWWRKTYLNTSTNTYFVTIDMDTWVELWNPSDQKATGTATIDLNEDSPVQVGNYSYKFSIKPADLQNSSTVATTYPSGGSSVATIPVDMDPNEYRTYHLRRDVFEYNTGVSPPLIFPPAGTSPHTLPISDSMSTNYELSWKAKAGNAVAVDRAGGGVQRLGGKLQGPPNYIASQKRWSGAYAGFSYTDDPNFAFVKFTSPGDPRASMYIGNQPSAAAPTTPVSQAAVAYIQGSSFWVRNNRPGVAATQIYAAVKPTSWPDRGHDTALVVTAPPTSGAASYADPPTTRPASAPTESTKAPATISNAGTFATVAELGNIFDPAQWNIAPDANNRWNDITSGSTADFRFGGGLSLRIGRPEFSRFDQPGTRAWQLLDLLTVAARTDTRGLININTASREALRALAAGVLLNRDPDVQDARGSPPTSLKDKLYPPSVTLQADKFADAVIAQRPFLSPAHLASLKTADAPPVPFFGNPDVWPATAGAQPTQWNDSGREEYFAKVFPLATVRSRNFRVFVTGQSLDKSGRVLSTVNKVFQVFLNPHRDGSGKVTNQKVDVIHATELVR